MAQSPSVNLDSLASDPESSASISRPSPPFRPLSFDNSVWKHEMDLRLQANQHGSSTSISFDSDSTSPEKVGRVFTKLEKRFLIILVSFAAIFSPLSSNIYFPALPTIAQNLHISITLVTLSITSYLIAQGIAPSFWGPLSDVIGRRPVFLATILVYLLSNIGLGLSKNFATLMVFRALQAAGSSATIALGSGVIGDITVQSERGGLMGVFSGLRMFGQAFGPVLGGILSQYLGFRSIFWFLLIAAGVVIVLLYMFLPETHRKYSSETSVPQNGIYRPGWDLLRNRQSKSQNHPQSSLPEKTSPPKSTLSWKIFQHQFMILCEKDVFITLLFGAVIYTVWSMVTASTSTLFKEEYDLSDVFIGLIFIPNGLGCILGSYTTGKTLDITYKSVEKAYRLSHDLPPPLSNHELSPSHQQTFPLEKARLRPIWYIVPVFIGSVAGYGWTLESHIAIPLTLQFIIAFTATAVFNINSTMVIDLYPSKPASATASSNLMRCLMGAVGVGVVDKLQEAYKERILFTSLAAFTLVSCALLVLEWTYGQRWRMRRGARLMGEGCSG